ncbi:MAG: hypothetical protein R6U88_03390 [Candidatus Bipolaricaulota bacterium]
MEPTKEKHVEEHYTTVKIMTVQPEDVWQCETCGTAAQECEFAACVEEGDHASYVCGQCIAQSIVALLHRYREATNQAESE